MSGEAGSVNRLRKAAKDIRRQMDYLHPMTQPCYGESPQLLEWAAKEIETLRREKALAIRSAI